MNYGTRIKEEPMHVKGVNDWQGSGACDDAYRAGGRCTQRFLSQTARNCRGSAMGGHKQVPWQTQRVTEQLPRRSSSLLRLTA
jgi:hypothetical protein